MIRRLTAVSAVIALVFSFCLTSDAQSFGNSGSRGGGMGSSGFGSSSFGSGGMGSSGFGGGGGGGGFGSSGFGGGGGMGSSGFGGGTGSSGFGGSSSFGNSGFGNSSGAGGVQNFIGRDATDMQATFGQMNKASTQFFNNMNKSMNRNNSNRKSTKQTAQHQTGQAMRVAVKVAFTPTRPSSNQMASAISTRLTRILAGSHMSPATVNMEGDTAVVSGIATSENERDVISQLLAIEPGIGSVRNEMTIGQPAGAASGTAPPAGS